MDEDTKRDLIELHLTINEKRAKVMLTRTGEHYTTKIPSGVWAALTNYLFDHLPPGQATTAILTGNMFELSRLDDRCREAFWEILRFLWTVFPQACWGSEEAVREWLAIRPEIETLGLDHAD